MSVEPFVLRLKDPRLCPAGGAVSPRCCSPFHHQASEDLEDRLGGDTQGNNSWREKEGAGEEEARGRSDGEEHLKQHFQLQTTGQEEVNTNTD